MSNDPVGRIAPVKQRPVWVLPLVTALVLVAVILSLLPTTTPS
jgi:hypothetical protein